MHVKCGCLCLVQSKLAMAAQWGAGTGGDQVMEPAAQMCSQLTSLSELEFVHRTADTTEIGKF